MNYYIKLKNGKILQEHVGYINTIDGEEYTYDAYVQLKETTDYYTEPAKTTEYVETAEEKQDRYHTLASRYIAEKYPTKDVEIALINNFNTGDSKYIQEYEEYQVYRIECKERAKIEVFETNKTKEN